jgi:hypothetical protein
MLIASKLLSPLTMEVMDPTRLYGLILSMLSMLSILAKLCRSESNDRLLRVLPEYCELAGINPTVTAGKRM